MEEEEDRGESDTSDLLWLAAIATCIKMLLVPSYHSTDFEVHRNWLAITHSLPVSKWYLYEGSEWTLDYPPFFAWFERLLAFFAVRFDPLIVDLNSHNYAGESCVLFQRATVMLADSVLYGGLWSYCRKMPKEKRTLIYIAVIFSPGLFMVDHIHFQYNGFLMGILLLSLSGLRYGRDVLGGICFTTLVCFKHLFAVAGPVYFVYLLRHYCRGFKKFFVLGISVIGVVGLAFAPFLYIGEMQQVLRRLFPFGRGLCHAYWAPNVWALYNTVDKLLMVAAKTIGFKVSSSAAYTRGLVGEFSEYAFLPKITPLITLLMVLLSLFPCLIRIWKKPDSSKVVNYITYAYMCGFIYGWHVHEKASLHFIIPLSLISVDTRDNASDYLFLSTVCYYSLFPLLFEPREYPIKMLMLLIYFAIMQNGFQNYFKKKEILGKYKAWYLLGIVIVEVYGQFIHNILLKGRLPFLPLMLTSSYCSLGMLYMWIKWFYNWINTN